MLYEIAKLYGVTVDYLLSKEHRLPVREMVHGKVIGKKRLIITLISTVLVWLAATVSFVILNLFGVNGPLWLSFIWALPASSVVLLVMNSVWGKKQRNFAIITVLMWTLLAAVYLTFLPLNMWLIFVIGVPLQIIIFLWAKMGKIIKKDKEP